MLLEGYRIKIFRPECNPRFSSLHCIAQLDQDVACALPYLNAVLGGAQYLLEVGIQKVKEAHDDYDSKATLLFGSFFNLMDLFGHGRRRRYRISDAGS
jgi:hypothetical protein